MKRFLMGLALVAGLLGGCGFHRPEVPHVPAPPIHAPVSPASPATSIDAQLAEAKGKVASLTAERNALRLAPLRVSIEWAEGLALLAILAGVALAVALRVWAGGVGMWKALGISAIGGAILATCLGTTWALDHVGWIVGAVVALGVYGVWWLSHSHVTLTKLKQVVSSK